jgi:hypothetical protein
MTSQDEITRTADRLRDALGAAASAMRDSPMVTFEPARRNRRDGAWLAPLAVAACVVVVAMAAVFAAGSIHRTAQPRGTGAVGATKPPEYFVTIGPGVKETVQLRRTADGRLVTSARLPGGVIGLPLTFSFAADNRTFFIPETLQDYCIRFYRYVIAGNGSIQGPQPVGAPYCGSNNSGQAAVSPDGKQMAFMTINGAGSRTDTAIHVMDLASGAVRSWHNTVTAVTPARVWFYAMYNSISWSGNRTLVFAYQWEHTGPRDLAVRSLDTANGGGSIQAHSRVLFSQYPSCSTCVYAVLPGPDPTSLSAVTLQWAAPYRQSVVRISTATGRQADVLYTSLGVRAREWGEFPWLVADGTGRYLALFSRSQPLPGWIADGHLIPFPGASPNGSLDVWFAW